MKLAQVQPTRPYTNKVSAWLNIGLAGSLSAIVLAQLFTFEDFADVLMSYPLLATPLRAQLIGTLIVVLEVLAVITPLRVPVSRLMRLSSMFAGSLVLAGWLVISGQAWLSGTDWQSGLFGATVALDGGWWEPLIWAALFMISLYAFFASRRDA